MRKALVAVLVVTAVGCGVRPPDGQMPPVSHVAVERLPQEPAHHPATAEELTLPPGLSGPAAVAASTITSALRAQGLVVSDVGVETVSSTGDRATVLVTATHVASSAATHTSVYELGLVREAGRWRIVGYRVVQ